MALKLKNNSLNVESVENICQLPSLNEAFDRLYQNNYVNVRCYTLIIGQ